MTDLSKITSKFDLQKIISGVKSIQAEAVAKISSILGTIHKEVEKSHKEPDAAATKPKEPSVEAPVAPTSASSGTKENK